MTPVWILGTIITVCFLVIGWLFVRAFKQSERAEKMAKESQDKAVEAKFRTDETANLLKTHVQHQNRRLDDFEKHEKERHDTVMTAINNLTKRIDNLNNGKA